MKRRADGKNERRAGGRRGREERGAWIQRKQENRERRRKTKRVDGRKEGRKEGRGGGGNH
jgi:hypothetical protein